MTGAAAAIRQPFMEVSAKAIEVMRPDEIEECKRALQQKIQDFIVKMFSAGIKASDISFEYINHLYEIYPNIRLHTELITKILNVLCDIATDDKMHVFFKEK